MCGLKIHLFVLEMYFYIRTHLMIYDITFNVDADSNATEKSIGKIINFQNWKFVGEFLARLIKKKRNKIKSPQKRNQL